jgi:hypothetical protein
MSTFKRAVATLPGIAAWLSMALAPMATPSPALAQGRPRADPSPASFCQGNRFTNGDFSQMEPGRTPDAANGTPNDQDIDGATGWGPLWIGSSLADLYSATTAGTGSPPIPANGNYASMWIQNNPSNAVDAGFREGMFNRLGTAIQANTGTYSFTFKAAPLNQRLTSAPSRVGIYGVYRPTTGTTAPPLPNAPLFLNVPANEDLFGAGSGVRLGTVSIPATTDNHWVTYTITFDSALLGSLPEITHVMVTHAGGGENQARYIAFDDFCMQTAADAGLPIPDTNISTCCPPSASFPLATLFSSVQGRIPDSYHLNFTLSPTLDAQMTAYVALAKTLDSSFLGLAMTIRIFDGGSGAAPVVASGSVPLEPDQGVHWHAGGGGGNPWSPSFFTSASDRPVNRWTVVEMTVWSLGPGRPWSPECEVRRFAFRPQLIDPL